MSSRQLTHIETDLLTKSLNFSITSKTLPNKEADTIRAKVSLTLQNSKPPQYNPSKEERNTLKELQSDTSIVVSPAA